MFSLILTFLQLYGNGMLLLYNTNGMDAMKMKSFKVLSDNFNKKLILVTNFIRFTFEPFRAKRPYMYLSDL